MDDVTLSLGVMVLFRDRFRLVAPIYRNRPFTFVQRHFGDVHPKYAYGTCTSPRSGTKFAHALIKYRLSQMSLHRIHHPTQKAVHDPRKAPLSSPRPKPIGALWLISQLFAQPACFPLASGWGSFLISQLFAQFTCFSIAKTPGYKPGVSKHILVIIAIQLFHFLFTRVRIVQLQSCLCIITAYTIHDLEY